MTAGPDALRKQNPSNEARNSKETTDKTSGKRQIPGECWNGKDDHQLDFDPPVYVCVCVCAVSVPVGEQRHLLRPTNPYVALSRAVLSPEQGPLSLQAP